MAKRVIAVQIDIAMEEGTEYETLLNKIQELIDDTEEFQCYGIGYTEDITNYYTGESIPKG